MEVIGDLIKVISLEWSLQNLIGKGLREKGRGRIGKCYNLDNILQVLI